MKLLYFAELFYFSEYVRVSKIGDPQKNCRHFLYFCYGTSDQHDTLEQPNLF